MFRSAAGRVIGGLGGHNVSLEGALLVGEHLSAWLQTYLVDVFGVEVSISRGKLYLQYVKGNISLF